MADTDEEVIVHIDEALATADDKTDPKVVVDKGTNDPLEDLRSQFNTLKSTADATQRERDVALQREAEANQRAEAAVRDAVQAKTQVAESQFDTVVSGLSAAEAEALAAQRDFEAAFDTGDKIKLGEAQRNIARAEAKISRLQEAKADIEEVSKKVVDKPDAQPQPRQQIDPVDAYINGRTEPTKNWLRAHKDWVTDPKKNQKLTAAHFDAQSEGIQPDTPEYFSHVEKFIGLDSGEKAKTTTQRRPSAPTVPVNHAGGGTSGGQISVPLTRAEAAAANDGTLQWNYDDPSPQKRFKKGDAIGNQEFVRRKLQMQKEGRYSRSMTDE